MPIRVTCQSCFQKFQVADKYAGRKGRCPNPECQEIFRVPRLENDWEDVSSAPAPRARHKKQQQPSPTVSSRKLMVPLSIGGGALLVAVLLVAYMLMGRTPSSETLASVGQQEVAAEMSSAPHATQQVSFEAPAPNVQRLDLQALKNDRSFEEQLVPFLKSYCYDCHEGEAAEADVRLDEYKTTADLLEHRKHWEKYLAILEIGAMPPSDVDQPTEEERLLVLAWLDNTLYNIDCDAINDPGRETIQRLNLAEYTNTIRDLFGIENLNPGRHFPADDVGEGFDNIGDVLSLPPLLMEKYLTAAEEITDAVIFETQVIPVVRHDGKRMAMKDSAKLSGTRVSFSSRGTATSRFKFAKRGNYLLRIQAQASQAGKDPAEMAIHIDGKSFKLVKISENRQTKVHEFDLQAIEGEFPVAISFVNDFYDPKARDPQRRDRNLLVDWIELEGPLSGVAVDPPPLHKHIVIAEPDENRSVGEAARIVFANFLPRAFRRPVSDEEVDQFSTFVEQSVNEFEESYEEGIRLGLQAALVSSSFLFRIEADPHPDDPNFKRPLDNFELASRLSYFLWSSMPDEQLFAAARQGTLTDANVMEQQVRRMLVDPKARALVENFGGQWLNLRNLEEINFDRSRFTTFDEQLRADMVAETFAFFSHVVQADKSILEFLTADYTFANERLSRHYGLNAIKGEQLQLVSLKGTPRAGILTQSSILALPSNPTRTSPVKRGKWIMENILGAPPPPPPPGVPELEETAKTSPNASLAEQLARHREDPGCASCHNQMDPLGLAFEKFDAVGQFREREGKNPIDDSGILPGGEQFAGARELVQILSQRKEEFAKNLSEKMLTYALGRGLKYYDICAVNDIVAGLQNDDYKFSRLVLEVVNSDPFRMRRGDGGIE